MFIWGKKIMTLLKSINPLQLLFLLITVSLTATAKNQIGFDLAPGTIADTVNEMVYVSHPEKGIDAISIVSGNVIWHSDQANRPILVRDGQLVAQADVSNKGIIELVAFESANGTVLSQKSLNAPSNIYAHTSEGLEHKFKIRANYDTNPLGDIEWNYSYEVAQGIAPQISLTDKPKDNKTYGQINFSQMKTPSTLSVLDSATLKTLSQKPISKMIAIEGKFLQQDEGRQFASLSQNHVLVSQINDNSSTWEKYKWDIYDTNNQLLGSFLHHNSYRPFEVVGDTVLFVTSPAINAEGNEVIQYPFMVNAYSLSSGTERWTQAVKDHKYNGSMPH